MNTIKIIEGNCPGCQAQQPQNMLNGLRDVEGGIEGEFSISRCKACGLTFLSQRPSDDNLLLCYGNEYHVRTDRTNNVILKFLFSIRYYLRLRRILKYHGNRPLHSVLEVGCGDAQFLYYLERRLSADADIIGIDVARGSSPAPSTSHVKIITASLSDLRIETKFDLILMYDVLEHLPDPGDAIRRAGKLLSEGGLLIIQVPNWNSMWRSIFTRVWSGLQIPRHIVFFNEQTLSDYCTRNGYSALSLRKVFDPGDLSVSISNWLVDTFHLRTLPRNTWFYFPITIMSAPFVFFQNILFNNSGEIEIALSRK